MSAPAGYTLLGIVGYADCGGYDKTRRYYMNQVVHYYGYPYVCIKASVKGIDPLNRLFWRPMVDPTVGEED